MSSLDIPKGDNDSVPKWKKPNPAHANNKGKRLDDMQQHDRELAREEKGTEKWMDKKLQEMESNTAAKNTENPELLKEALLDITNIEKTWSVLKQLTREERKTHPASKELQDQYFYLFEKFEKLSDAQIRTFITEQKGFQRISDLYFNMYQAEVDKSNSVPGHLMNVQAVLAKRAPDLVVQQAISGRFFEQSSEIIDDTLGQRELFFTLAKDGPIGTEGYGKGKPYMHYVWYAKISQDLEDGTVKVSPKILQEAKPATVDGKKLFYLYKQGGFDLARTVASLGSIAEKNTNITEKIGKNHVLQKMFLYATHPSPGNGHVSLSAQMVESLADLAEKNPKIFAAFIDVRDPLLGQTPREFFVANSEEKTEDMPFMQFTDAKRSSEYREACKRLVAALGDRSKQ